jgi:hypothetical protein
MRRPPFDTAPTASAAEAFDPVLEGLVARSAIIPEARSSRGLRCASSGYLGDGCRCERAIPERVVIEAWDRERLFGNDDDRFFRVVWRDEVWLAYGLSDGSVRGVNCPQHRAERQGRSFDFSNAEEASSIELAPV